MTQGERIKFLRDNFIKEDGTKGLQQKELADMIGVKASAMSRFEQSDNLRPETIKKIAGALNVSYNYIKYGNETFKGNVFGNEIYSYTEKLKNAAELLEECTDKTEKEEITSRIKDYVKKDIDELSVFVENEINNMTRKGFYFFFVEEAWNGTKGNEEERLLQFRESLEDVKKKSAGNPLYISYDDLSGMEKDIATKISSIITSVMVGGIF